MAVKNGDTVTLEYEGRLDDGTVFDSTDNHEEPLVFEVGAHTLMEAFESKVVGMKKGDEKEFKLKPEEAYGEYDKNLVKRVPRDQMPKGEELTKGMMLVLGLPDGIQIPALILEVSDDTVTIDLNHPLAGKELTFKIKVVDIAS